MHPLSNKHRPIINSRNKQQHQPTQRGSWYQSSLDTQSFSDSQESRISTQCNDVVYATAQSQEANLVTRERAIRQKDWNDVTSGRKHTLSILSGEKSVQSVDNMEKSSLPFQALGVPAWSKCIRCCIVNVKSRDRDVLGTRRRKRSRRKRVEREGGENATDWRRHWQPWLGCSHCRAKMRNE